MKMDIWSFSIQGKREQQQDHCNYIVEKDYGMAVVCDGMGGLQGGALASRYASNRFGMDYKIWKEIGGEPAVFLEEEGIRLDEGVFRMRDAEGGCLGAGTTLASIIYEKEDLYWLSVGDSKIYIYRNNRLKCLTREHNYGLFLNDMLVSNSISLEEYEKKKDMAEKLISYIGMGNMRIMDTNLRPLKLLENDILVLCTDGVHRTLSEEKIAEILYEYQAMPEQIVTTIQQAIETADINGQDNATAIVVAVKG